METIEIFKGITVIDKILEFVALTPDEKHWNYKALGDNMPRLIRLKQINSLLHAFSLTANRNILGKATNYLNPDLRADINPILGGDFITNRSLDTYHELADFVKCFLQERNSGMDRDIRVMELRFIYPKMINYKIKLREIIGFNSGWMEASMPFALFHILLTDSISANLKDKYGDLDHVLELIINPAGLAFTEKELIEKFNYPKDDLHQLDLENY
ncbi:hypothetical protein HNQ91_005883 [Filimonas zeae]|uniref:Uncharacterized protein n=1 Tax=Filimonas zeae TaxID=1737353 RepID=A0A917N143_9BACT|nr:hypothetical protein [Filimonas zeae]MDR6342796.1 hypothetical protein [Filimonas zeae]GGH82741.1 hypothetical protein GCM10011379_57080 [Filimonas zeae]